MFSSRRSNQNAPVTFVASGADRESVAKTMGVDPEGEPDVYAFLCKALDAPLPIPWTEHADKKGRIFYWNPASRYSSWQHPLAPSHKALIAAYRRVLKEEIDDRQAAIQDELVAFKQQIEEEINKWRQSEAQDGTPYYYKVGTQVTRWDNPREELMHHMELRVKMLQELLVIPDPEPTPTLPGADEDLERTQALQSLDDVSNMPASPTAITDSGAGPALMDASGAISPATSAQQMQLAVPSDQEEDRGRTRSTLRSFVGMMSTMGRRRSRSSQSSAGSEGGGSASPGSSTARSLRSISNFFTSGFRRNKSNERKKATGRMSPKMIQRREVAALKVGRAARQWLQWTRAKKYEAALTIQKMWRGYLGKKNWILEWERQQEELRRAAMLPPDLQRVEKGLLEVMMSPLGKHRQRIAFDRSKLLGLQGDPDLSKYIIPDEIALQHHMNFDLPMDKAIFNIIRPLLLRPLPVPWQVLRREHGRTDFYHAGVKEERRRHPLHGFFGEVITFLKAHIHTNVLMTEPMTAQIFREASPQALRQRLGVWEGPHEDTSQVGGVRFTRLVPGIDPDCAEGEERVDDPRLEAASNATARLTAWLHLWTGFNPEEPFPFLEGRIPALAAQISENVVVAPGAASKALLAQLAGAPPLAVLAAPANPVLDPKDPEVLPLTKEEEALQPLVTGMLGKAYGAALTYVSKHERGLLEAAQEVKPEVVVEEESEGEYTEVGEDEDYEEESFAEEEEFDEETESEGSEQSELSEDISAATTTVTPSSSRRPMDDLDAIGKQKPEDETDHPPKEIESFLPAYREQSASDWASRMLRPLTPTEDRKPEVALGMPGSPGKRPWQRLKQRPGELHLWGENKLLPDSTIRLELKEPKLEDWGDGPPGLAEAGAIARVPLSPKDRQRAAAALPHLAAPMAPGALAKIRSEQDDKVDEYKKSLMQATNFFDSEIDEADDDDSLSPGGRWRCGKRNPGDADRFRTGRRDLQRPDMPGGGGGGDFKNEDGICALPGRIARLVTPTKGDVPLPPHLAGSTEFPKKGTAAKAWPVQRTSSADAAMRSRARGLVMPLESPRPRSADARARKRCKGLLPEKPSRAAQTAALSCKRFLSRTCGTMQLALATFDSTGDGKFNRWEWETGLEKLGYEANYDVQEIFTILDKRQHHVLTLSDLLDRYKGSPVTEGMPEPGLGGIASEILHEAMLEMIGPCITKGLSVLLEKELLNPRGAPWKLPDVKAWLKKRDPNRRVSTADSEIGPLEGDSHMTVTSPANKKGKLRRQDNTPVSPSDGLSPKAKSPGRRTKKNLTKFQAVGMMVRRKGRGSSGSLNGTLSAQLSGTLSRETSGVLSRTSGSRKGSPSSSTTGRFRAVGKSLSLVRSGLLEGQASSSAQVGPKRKVKGKTGTAGRRAGTSASPSRSPKPGGSKSSPQLQRNRRASPGPGKTPVKQADSGQKRVGSAAAGTGAGQPRSLQRRPQSQPQRRAVRPENKYVGFKFVKDDELSEELADWEREQQLPWVPRPTEDICKTYGHIFRLLNDPRTRKMSQKPQKRSVHVSVPRMPTLPPGRGGSSLGGSGSLRPDEGSEEDAPEGLAPLPSMKGGKRQYGAKSSPDLLASGLSTTVGASSYRPSSAGSQGSEDDPDRMRVSLPQLLKGGSPSKAAPILLDPLGSRIDAGVRRRVPPV